MRDVLTFPFNSEETIVAACDNSGAIGEKEPDAVHVPYETVSYYSFRVAVMECMSAGANPFAASLQNFCGNDAWDQLLRGIKKGADELGMAELQITGSTESNFNLLQSAVGLTVLGKRKGELPADTLIYTEDTKIAVIGTPLVGLELIEREEEAAPLKLFKAINSIDEVVTLPIGSKGILKELNCLFSNKEFKEYDFESHLDLKKSAGPATCFIAVFPEEKSEEISKVAGGYLHMLESRT
ncbi:MULTISPECIES: ATP-binding protein [Cytobacillus]|uniref:ATP-binding protein n=1 Tax=Cytobacillus TaxID=2675230 RepID=UPI00203AB795|nr:ATP-binding protein [Cytobacillus firmus]MCM3707150.1 ATP-binding protein [Cytobacillus firmus]